MLRGSQLRVAFVHAKNLSQNLRGPNLLRNGFVQTRTIASHSTRTPQFLHKNLMFDQKGVSQGILRKQFSLSNNHLMSKVYFRENQNSIRSYSTEANQNNQNNSDSSYEEAGSAVKWWMTGCAALVYGIIIVGGITRLTESGLSMTDWKFLGGMPPSTHEEWVKEFEKYKQFPEFKRLFPTMTVEEFKNIYFWEYLHRMWGRAIGLAVAVPLVAFAVTKKIRGPLLTRSTILLGGVVAQGLLGWWMVKSGLEEPENPRGVPRVSQYRLAAHLGAALTLYVGMVWTALDLWFPKRKALLGEINPKKLKFFQRSAFGLFLLVSTTAISGAFLAGLDGGVAYSMFPLMEEGRFKAENAWNLTILRDHFTSTWAWAKDNLCDNVAGVQFNHRVLALTTAGCVGSLYYSTRKIARYLPRGVQLARHALLGIVVAQVTLGISTLLLLVPVPIASAHQAGSVALLSTALWLLHGLRRIRF